MDDNIAARYQDVAEWVYSPMSVASGTVVVLDARDINRVIPSFMSYDTRVASVVSDTPGILLGESGDGKVKVATTGRVKVKADATHRPINAGDLLVTSDSEGYAIRSEPLDLGGTPIHRLGTILGKALEPLSEGKGEILVVILDMEHSNQVVFSSNAYDTRVAGVVSATPGLLLGEAGEGKVKVATTGRVKVKVDATRKPIRVGDLLVTSDQEGMAMRSEPLDFGGIPIHRPGTILGKALESLSEGKGEILVLLTLQ